jgi:hypothetical protein
MTDNSSISPRRPCKFATISGLQLKIADHRALGNFAKGNNIANVDRSFPTEPNVLPNKNAFWS